MTTDIRLELIELLPRLRRFAYALTGDPTKGDDLLQEGCTRAFANLDQYQPGTRLDKWMYTILRNTWLNQQRASRVRGLVVNLDDAPDQAGEDGRDLIETRLTLGSVLQALAKLPAEQKELITLVCVEGLSYQEAADILEIPLGTATSRLARGRRALYAIAVEGLPTPEVEHDEVN